MSLDKIKCRAFFYETTKDYKKNSQNHHYGDIIYIGTQYKTYYVDIDYRLTPFIKNIFDELQVGTKFIIPDNFELKDKIFIKIIKFDENTDRNDFEDNVLYESICIGSTDEFDIGKKYLFSQDQIVEEFYGG